MAVTDDHDGRPHLSHQPNPELRNGYIIRFTTRSGAKLYRPQLVDQLETDYPLGRGWAHLGPQCRHWFTTRAPPPARRPHRPHRAGTPLYSDFGYARVASAGRHLVPARRIDLGDAYCWWNGLDGRVGRPATAFAPAAPRVGAAARSGRSPLPGLRDDPVDDGPALAAAVEVLLPSDRPSRGSPEPGAVRLTAEDKEVAELYRQGLLYDDCRGLDMRDIVHEEPAYSVRLVRKRGQRKGRITWTEKAPPVEILPLDMRGCSDCASVLSGADGFELLDLVDSDDEDVKSLPDDWTWLEDDT